METKSPRCSCTYKDAITVSTDITHVSVMRIGYNAIDEEVNAVCITRTYTYAYWFLYNLSHFCEDITLTPSSS